MSKKNCVRYFQICKHSFLMLLFFSVDGGYWECLGFVCMLFMSIVTLNIIGIKRII